MTGTETQPSARAARRLLTLAAATLALSAAGLLLAGPASAEVPEGWPAVPPVDTLELLAILVGIPLGLALLITAFVYVPDMVRGERVAPGATGPEDQWLGGRRSAAELTARPDEAAETRGGGASARW